MGIQCCSWSLQLGTGLTEFGLSAYWQEFGRGAQPSVMKSFFSFDINSLGEVLGSFIKNPWNLFLICYWQMEIPQPVFKPNSMHVARASLEYKMPVNWSKYRRRALFLGPGEGGKVVEDLSAWNSRSLSWVSLCDSTIEAIPVPQLLNYL